MAHVLQVADLTDQGILVELKMPLSSKRLDVLITGSNPDTRATRRSSSSSSSGPRSAARTSPTASPSTTAAGRATRLHPSRQVAQYQRYLHRHAPGVLRRPRDRARRLRLPALRAARPDVAALPRRLRDAARHQPGLRRRPVGCLRDLPGAARRRPGRRRRSSSASPRPPSSRTNACSTTSPASSATSPTFVLLDEQLVAYNAILDAVRDAGQNQQHVVFLIEGGPGTGKSVIALNLVAELAERGLSTLHLTGSKAFTENLRKIVGGRAGALFKYFRDTATVTDKLDVAILDEAHRIRTISTSRFTPAKARTGKSQIDDILDSSRVTVFFIDDLQVVRPGEVGSTDLIREEAAKRSIEVRDFKLEAQFRSNGSDSFIQWVDNTLELTRTPQVLWSMDDEFDFQIVGSIGELEQNDPRQGRRAGRPLDSSPASAGPGPTPTTTASSCRTSG